MRKTITRTGRGLIILAALTATTQGYTSEDPMNVQIHTLKNGLTVYLSENHQSPRFYAEIAVRAGSKHDPSTNTGLAHYLEHLLFKGTGKFGTNDFEKEKAHLDKITELYEKRFKETDPKKRKELYDQINSESQAASKYAIPNEFSKTYRQIGGSKINAHTWVEETVYKVELPSNRLHHWAAIESERFLNPIFRLFQPELEVVYEEKNRSMDNKSRLINEAVRRLLYKKHPYGQQPTLGSAEHLKNPSIQRIYDFYHTFYIPENMAIFISGDINSEETLKVIEKYFGVLPEKKLPEAKSWKEDPLKGVERVEVQYKAEPFVLIGFRTASQNHKEAPALKLADMILDNSVAGLINLNLNQSQAVRRAGSYPSLYNDNGTQQLWGIPKKDQSLEDVEKLLLAQVEKLRKGEFEDWVIPAIITDYKKERKKQLENNGARVALMRDSFLAYRKWDFARDEIERMAKVTKVDVVKVAQKYFGGDYVVGYRKDGKHNVPSIEKPKLDKIDIDDSLQSVFMKNVLSMGAKPIEPVFLDPKKDYQDLEYAKGAQLLHSKNPVNDLFEMSIYIEKGSRHDNRLGVARELLNKSGTETFSAEDIKKEWYKLGTDFSIHVDQNETTITLTGLDENFAKSVELMMSLLNNPKSDDKTLEELVEIHLARREDSFKDHKTIVHAVSHLNLYGKDSSYLGKLPASKMRKLKTEELFSLIKSLFDYRHSVAYTGTRTTSDVASILQKYVDQKKELKKAPKPFIRKTLEPKENQILFFHKEMAQAMVRIGYGNEIYDEGKRHEVDLFNNFFSGGMNSVVWQRLREARALAYEVWAWNVPGDFKGEQNIMVGFIGTQADKTIEALDSFITLLDNPPIVPERFVSAKGSAINQYRTTRLSFRQVLPAVLSWDRLGVKVDPREKRYERVGKTELKDLVEFHEKQLKGRTKLISIVGDKTKIDMKGLEKFGVIKEVKTDDIFVTD